MEQEIDPLDTDARRQEDTLASAHHVMSQRGGAALTEWVQRNWHRMFPKPSE